MRRTSTLLAIATLYASICVHAQAASVDDTRLGSPTGNIIDLTGAKWTLNGGYIYVNGVRDQHSSNVICLAYEDGHVWQENTSHMWYRKTKPSDTWTPSGGTANSPLPPITALVANGTMKIRTDPQTMVGITAISSNNNYQGSTTVSTDNYGNVSVPTSSLFGHNTYLVSEFRKPMLLSRLADITMFSAETYNAGNYKFCCGDDYLGDLQNTYGTSVTEADWTTLVALQKANPAAFSLFAKSLEGDALILYKGSSLDANGNAYFVRHYGTSNGISLSSDLYLDADFNPQAKIVYQNFGPASYTFNTIGSVTVVVP